MTDKEKTMRLKHWIYQYRSDLAMLKYYEDINYYPRIDYSLVRDQPRSSGSYLNERLDKMNQLYSRIKMIEQGFQAIGEEYARIIRKDFYEEEKFWWMDYYSRSTYYRRKKEAILAFLNYLDDVIVF